MDGYLAAASDGPRGNLTAIIAPHAGMMFSGPVAAYSYKATGGRQFDVAVLVGPSHFVAFEGAALWPDGGFDSPLGIAPIDEASARALTESPIVKAMPSAHQREHSLEMQLPFVRRMHPGLRHVQTDSNGESGGLERLGHLARVVDRIPER